MSRDCIRVWETIRATKEHLPKELYKELSKQFRKFEDAWKEYREEYHAGRTVTPSCGCVFCDLDLKPDEEGFHATSTGQPGIICTKGN